MWEKYKNTAENLFSFVWVAETDSINSNFFELDIIESLENIELSKRFFVNLDEEGDIIGDKRLTKISKSFLKKYSLRKRVYRAEERKIIPRVLWILWN